MRGRLTSHVIILWVPWALCPITNTCRPTIGYGGLVHGNGPDPCSHSSPILIQSFVFIHPLPSSPFLSRHCAFADRRLVALHTRRCSITPLQKRNDLIRYTYFLTPNTRIEQILGTNSVWSERASKETKKGERIGHCKVGSRQADGFLLLLFGDTRVVGWRGGSVTVCGGERAGAIRHSRTLRRVRVQWGRGERAGSCGVGGFHRPPVHRLQDRVAGGEEGVGALRQLPCHHCAPFPCPVRIPACFLLFPPTCSALSSFLLVVGCQLQSSTNVAV